MKKTHDFFLWFRDKWWIHKLDFVDGSTQRGTVVGLSKRNALNPLKWAVLNIFHTVFLGPDPMKIPFLLNFLECWAKEDNGPTYLMYPRFIQGINQKTLDALVHYPFLLKNPDLLYTIFEISQTTASKLMAKRQKKLPQVLI